MRFLSFDVGVRSLSLVLFTVPNPPVKVKVVKKRAAKKTKLNVANLDTVAKADDPPKKEETVFKPVNQLDIEYWECVDLYEDNDHEFEFVKSRKKKDDGDDDDKKPKKEKKKMINLDTKLEYIRASLKKRSFLYQRAPIDHILIENQPLKSDQKGNKLGSLDNKVLSYAIYHFFAGVYKDIQDHYTFSQENKLHNLPPCCEAVYQKNFNCECPNITFVNPSLKLKKEYIEAFCKTKIKSILAVRESNTKSIDPTTKQTKLSDGQAYSFRKTASIVYVTQLLNCMPASTKFQTKLQAAILNKPTTAKAGLSTTAKAGPFTTAAAKSPNKLDTKECKIASCLMCARSSFTPKDYKTLYLDYKPGERKYNKTAEGKTFHHNVIDGKSKDRRSDLGDCFLQAIVYYMRYVVKLKLESETT